FSRDWSSDVCSSDLNVVFEGCCIDVVEDVHVFSLSATATGRPRFQCFKKWIVPKAMPAPLWQSRAKSTRGNSATVLCVVASLLRSEERRVGKACRCG